MNGTEKVLRIEQNIIWLPRPNEGQMILSLALPPQELITTAFVLAFVGDQLLMTHLRSRGWDIPGGHVEPGEHPEDAAHREVFEETGATLETLQFFGYQRLQILAPRPTAYRYPYPESYQTFYSARVASLGEFQPTTETLGYALFSPAEAQTLAWIQMNKEFYEAALQMTQTKI